MTNESSEFEKVVTKADEMDGYQIYMSKHLGRRRRTTKQYLPLQPTQ